MPGQSCMGEVGCPAARVPNHDWDHPKLLVRSATLACPENRWNMLDILLRMRGVGRPGWSGPKCMRPANIKGGWTAVIFPIFPFSLRYFLISPSAIDHFLFHFYLICFAKSYRPYIVRIRMMF